MASLSCPFSPQFSEMTRAAKVRLGGLRRRVAIVGGLLALSMGGFLAAVNGLALWFSIDKLSSLHRDPAAVDGIPTTLVWERNPEILGWSAALGIVAIVDCVVGLVVLNKIVGPARRLPRKVFRAIVGAPLGLAGATAAVTAQQGPVILLLLSGPLAGLVCWLVLVQATVVHIFLLTSALKQAKKRYVTIRSSELPVEASDHFDQFDSELIDCGFQWIGDQKIEPGKNKFRRLWTNASHTVYASASWFQGSSGSEPLSDFSTTSQTEDGAFFEVSNISSTPTPVPDACVEQMAVLPNAPATHILQKHHELLSQWLRNKGARPLQIALADEPALCAYGLGYYQHINRGTHAMAEILWLGSPYADQPLTPAPGRPWNPEQESLDGDDTGRAVASLSN